MPRTGGRSGQKTYTSDSGVSDAGTSTAGATGKVVQSFYADLHPPVWDGHALSPLHTSLYSARCDPRPQVWSFVTVLP